MRKPYFMLKICKYYIYKQFFLYICGSLYKNSVVMRKFLIVFLLGFTVAANAQYYGSGTSTTGQTDIFGNTTITHKNAYGW